MVQGGDLVTRSSPACSPQPGGYSHLLLVPTDMAKGSEGQQPGVGGWSRTLPPLMELCLHC